MKHRLKTRAGRAAYALRKQTVEPVFGLIKSVMGFRQFLLRGLVHASHEWTVVCLAWNFKRMAVLHRSEEHTSVQSLMRISYAVFCLKNNINHAETHLSTPANQP